MIQLESIEHDYIRSIKSQSYKQERRVLDLESEVMRGAGSILTGGNIVHWIFLFSHSKAPATNIDIIDILVHFEKTLLLDEVMSGNQ